MRGRRGTNRISLQPVPKTGLDRVDSAQQILVLCLKVVLPLVCLVEFFP
jgi:hypothetical protein